MPDQTLDFEVPSGDEFADILPRHTHSQAEVAGLIDTLLGKADKTHTHTISDVSGLPEELMELKLQNAKIGRWK